MRAELALSGITDEPAIEGFAETAGAGSDASEDAAANALDAVTDECDVEDDAAATWAMTDDEDRAEATGIGGIETDDDVTGALETAGVPTLAPPIVANRSVCAPFRKPYAPLSRVSGNSGQTERANR